jgi:hypothetical protein
MVTVLEDKLAGHDDEALVGSAVECLVTTIQELGELAGIRSGRTVRELAGVIVGDTGLGGVGDHETHLGLVGQCEECVGLGEGAETAADYVNAGERIDHFAIETALEVHVVEAVLTLEKLHHECVGGTLHNDYRRVEVGLVVHVLDDPVYKRTEEVTFAKLNDSLGSDCLRSGQFV